MCMSAVRHSRRYQVTHQGKEGKQAHSLMLECGLLLQSQLEEALATQMAMQRKLHEQLEVCERSACGLAVCCSVVGMLSLFN